MLGLYTLATVLICLLGLSTAKSSTGDSVLIILDPAAQENYSIFFGGLREQGYKLTFRAPKDEAPVLIQDDVPSFDHVLMLASDTKNFAKDITPQNIVQLLSLNTNVIIALSPKQNIFTSLASEFSLILPPPGTPLISHFPERKDPLTVIPVQVPSAPMLTPNTPPVWFSGVPFAFGNSPLLVPILNAPVESFAADSDSTPDSLVDAADKGGEGLWAGRQLGLVAGFQPSEGARATFVGSAEIFSDKFAKKDLPTSGKSGNTQFARDLTAWAFQESLVLRIDETTHHLVNKTEPEEHYTTNDQIVYTTYISRFNPTTGAFEPYSGLTDLQLEFTMLDPHIRTALPAVTGEPGKYEVTFRAPDRHGVFKFVVNYKRKGWTYLQSAITVPVVPPRHDGYPRFLSAAWPYYVGAISTSVGFFLFSAMWLAGEVRETKKGKKTE
ncbi:Dolichyl-diphosphooligosaccharide--protein glycosyltransferase subunit WBP1 [Mucidula mucida]|nr:Dolichyl-diphosphooligosaccharide--protein glycosyltransferase subunit WBP1 [Mucidula mucida]